LNTPLHTTAPPTEPSATQLTSGWRERSALPLAALVCLAVPLSVVATNLAMLLLVVWCIVNLPLLRQCRPWRNPVMALGLALYVWIVLRAMTADATVSEQASAINHYRELWLAPLLLALFTVAARVESSTRQLLLVLIAATCVLGCVQWATLVHEPLRNAMVSKRISTGFFLACGAFLAVHLAVMYKHQTVLRALLALAALLLAASALIAVEGRTGHVLLLGLGALSVWHFAPRKWRLLGAVVCLVALAAAALQSPAVTKRIAEGKKEWQTYQSGEQIITSTGLRMEFVRNSAALAAQHPAVGVGYGNFADAYRAYTEPRYKANTVIAPQLVNPDVTKALYTSNPHNEFLMHAASGGVPGVLLFIAWLAAAAWLGWRSESPFARMLFGMVAAMAVGCMLNSFLLDAAEGHFYIATLALLLAGMQHGNAAAQTSV
jgi:O-antigen ligase